MITHTKTIVANSLRLASDPPHQSLAAAEEHAAALVEMGCADVTIQTAPRQVFIAGSDAIDDHWETRPGKEYWVWVPLNWTGGNATETMASRAAFEAAAAHRSEKRREARRLILESHSARIDRDTAGDIWLGYLTDQQIDGMDAREIAATFVARHFGG